MWIPESILRAAQKLREALLKEKGIFIYHDRDQDGIVSAALLQEFLEKNGIRVQAAAADRDAIHFEPGKTYVLVDIPLSEELARRAAEKGVQLYCIDHHEPAHVPPNTFALNPYLLDNVGVHPSRWNTSLLVWILREMDNESDWKVAAAHWADHAIDKHSRDWIESIYKKYGEDTITATAKLIGLAKHFPDKITENEMREIVKNARHPDDILKHPLLNSLDAIARKEFDRLLREVLEHPLLETDNLVYHLVESPVGKIKSPLATVVGDKKPDKILIIGQEEGGVINYSLRCQNASKLGIHLGEIAKEAATLFGGVGGGHPPAAGLKIPKEKEQEFREWIKRKISAHI